LGLRDELDEIFISSVAHCKEHDLIYFIIFITIGSSFFRELELDTDDGLDLMFDTRLIELERSIHITNIRDCDSSLTEFLSSFYESLRISECLLESIVSMSMQVNE
jgi:hypothetical protein